MEGANNSLRDGVVVRQNSASRIHARPEPFQSGFSGRVQIGIEMDKRKGGLELSSGLREKANVVIDPAMPQGEIALNRIERTIPLALIKLALRIRESFKGVEQMKCFRASLQHDFSGSAVVDAKLSHVAGNLFAGFGPLPNLHALKRSSGRINSGRNLLSQLGQSIARSGNYGMNAVLKPAQKGVAWHLAILAFALLAPLQLLGQSCTTATCNAASASLSDVLAALPSTSNANATVTVNIPAGSATWSSPLNYTIPAGVANPTAVTTLIIQGATTINCTGTAGQSSWSCPATDSTIITDGVTNANTPTINITTGGSTTFFRITGLTLKTASGTAKNDGMMKIGGASQNVRIDHNHIDENGQNNSMIETVGSVAGVADHNLFSLGNNSNVGNGFRNFSSSDGVGDAAWNSATSWGTTGNWWYLESDYFTGGSPTDCYNGGKLVVRYSTINNAFVMALHGTKNDAGRGRSCRATEIYQNYMSGSPNANAVIGQNGGTSMLWGNNIASGYNHFNAPGAPRNFTGGDSGTSPWAGMCGTTVRSAAGQSGTAAYDGNSSSSTGYPCLDGVGRGQGNLLSGTPATPTAWPSQKLEPEYMWMNTLASADLGYINDVSTLPNRDVYADCNGKTFAGTTCSSFAGIQGTGFGLHSARPASCSAGPSGTYGASPTGSYGVGYWETDTNTFFVCTATNTWTSVYTPLSYPHPLAGGTTTTHTLSTATTGSGSGTINGCAGTYAMGDPYTCSVTPASGSTISSVTGCGGSGTSTYAGAMPASNCTVTATFQVTVPTPTFSPVAGTYSSAQQVAITDSFSSPNVVISIPETGNGNASTGTTPHGNTYTNCATGYSGGQLQPAGQPVGTLYCTSADKTAAVAAGGPNNGVVSSTITGTGTSALDNGNGAGGSDSPTSVTATYGGATGTSCEVGTNAPSALVSGLNLPGKQANSQLIMGITTGSPGNSSILTVKKYNYSGDAANLLVRQDCVSPNSASVSGEHYEWDDNYNDTAGTYFGFGFDYNFPTQKFRSAPQGASWTDLELCPFDGSACITTYSWPANQYLYTERYEHYSPGCSPSSGSACAFYDAMCVQLWSGGSAVNSMTCYHLKNASTHAPISFIPISKTSWTHPQYAVQHQWDINQSSQTLTATIAFSHLVAYNYSGLQIFYTNNGSTPTTSSTLYTLPVSVSTSQTLKALGTAPSYANSAIGSASYTITAGSSYTLTITAPNATVTGTNSTSGTYTSGTTLGAYTITAAPGYTITSITGTGSTSGCTSSPCGSYTLSSNSSITVTTVQQTVATPTFSPGAGTYVGTQTVTLSTATSGATICYTTDGSTPTASSGTCTHGSTYSVPISVASSETVKAIGSKSTYLDSPVGSAAYVINSSTVHVTLSGVQFQGSVKVQ